MQQQQHKPKRVTPQQEQDGPTGGKPDQAGIRPSTQQIEDRVWANQGQQSLNEDQSRDSPGTANKAKVKVRAQSDGRRVCRLVQPTVSTCVTLQIPTRDPDWLGHTAHNTCNGVGEHSTAGPSSSGQHRHETASPEADDSAAAAAAAAAVSLPSDDFDDEVCWSMVNKSSALPCFAS